MKVIKNGVEITDGFYFGETPVSKLIKGEVEIWQSGSPPPPPETIHAGVLGDSTIAAGYGGLVVPAYIEGMTYVSTAYGGSKIAGQHTQWMNLGYYDDFRIVIIQIGLNDMQGGDFEAVRTRYQALVDQVRETIKPNCKIYVSKMLPCKQRWWDLYGEEGGPLAYDCWQKLNSAIAGEGGTPIRNVDGRIVSHVPLLDDGTGNLKPEYDSGDHIHETPAGRIVIANAWRSKIVEDGLLAE